jgi:AraC family transcriptional activator of tynA and feaB
MGPGGIGMHYSTSAVPATRRLAYWNDTVNGVFESLNVDSRDDRFGAQMACRRLGALEIAMVESSAATVRRVRRGDAADGSRPMIKVHLQDMGSSVNSQGGWDTTLRDGEFILCDGARPYSIDFTSSNRMLVLRFPAECLANRFGEGELFAGRRLGRGPRSAMFASFFRNAWTTAETARDELWDETVSGVMLDLLILALQERDEEEVPALNPEWGRRLRAHIEEHLHEPELRTSTLAALFGVTPRYVQMVFAGMSTTASAYILDRRLERAAERLRQGLRDVPISEVAFDLGFQDLSHFSRSFRARYGVSAKQYRAGCRA